MKKYQFLSKNFQFLEVKFFIYLNRRVFVMGHTGLTVVFVVRLLICKIVCFFVDIFCS